MSLAGQLRKLGLDPDGRGLNVFDGEVYARNLASPYGKNWYVDPNRTYTGSGKKWASAFTTMAEAFAACASGDRIFFVGNILEQISTPVGIFDVSVIGAGKFPRHADSHPVGCNLAPSTWRPLAAGTATPCCNVRQAGWHFENFVAVAPTAEAFFALRRENPDAADELDSSWMGIKKVKFWGGRDAIKLVDGPWGVHIYDSIFAYLTGYCIKQTAGPDGVSDPWYWKLIGNNFSQCANWLDTINAHFWEIRDNMIAKITTKYCDFSGGEFNSVVGNSFAVAAADFDPTGGVTPSASDVWSNHLIDALESGVPADA